MNKRTVATIKQYDYKSKEDFTKDIEKMNKKGYTLIKDGMFNNCLEPQEVCSEKWKYTAYFIKESL